MSKERHEVRLAGHLPGLDGVRGVAVVAVTGFHSFEERFLSLERFFEARERPEPTPARAIERGQG